MWVFRIIRIRVRVVKVLLWVGMVRECWNFSRVLSKDEIWEEG